MRPDPSATEMLQPDDDEDGFYFMFLQEKMTVL
jgi:hypothetical protein